MHFITCLRHFIRRHSQFNLVFHSNTCYLNRILSYATNDLKNFRFFFIKDTRKSSTSFFDGDKVVATSYGFEERTMGQAKSSPLCLVELPYIESSIFIFITLKIVTLRKKVLAPLVYKWRFKNCKMIIKLVTYTNFFVDIAY